MDISALTDGQLRDSLKEYGVNVGPIVASTRRLYEKKLTKLVDSNGAQDVSSLSEVNGSNASMNGNIVDVQRNSTPLFVSESPVPVFDEAPVEARNDASDSDDYEGEESMRFLTEEEMAADRAAARQSQPRKGGVFGNALTFAVLFVSIAVFAYFLLENVEQLKALTEPKSDDII